MQYTLALITGASSGLGRDLAKLLARQHIALILHGREQHALTELANDLSQMVAVDTLQADLLQKEGREKVLAAIREKSPDLVINNAGIGLYGEILTFPLEEQMNIVETNITALTQISIEGARTLIQNKLEGTIVNISSVAGFFPYPTLSIYAASKSFVTNFSQGFDAEVKRLGVRVLTVCPGQIDTSFQRRASKGYPQKTRPWVLSSERAAQLVWQKVVKKKKNSVIGFRYGFIAFVARYLLPRYLLEKILRQGIKDRYPSKDLFFK